MSHTIRVFILVYTLITFLVVWGLHSAYQQ